MAHERETSEVELAIVDAGDDLDEDERERLHTTLFEAQGQIDRGEGIPAKRVIERLRRAGSDAAPPGYR